MVVGYGWAGQGVAERARGAGAAVIVCEVDPLRALEARMAGYEVMPALEAAERGDMFITVTGSRRVLRGEHFERMKDGALLANAGHFDVELDLDELRALAAGGSARSGRWSSEYVLADGRRLNLLAPGRVVNLAAAEGHPAAVMDVSFALQALCVEELVRRRGELRARACTRCPAAIDREVGRLKLAALGVEIDEPTPEQADYRDPGPERALNARAEGVARRRTWLATAALRGGIDLGGTKIEAIIVDADNRCSASARQPTPTTGGPDDVAAQIVDGDDLRRPRPPASSRRR